MGLTSSPCHGYLLMAYAVTEEDQLLKDVDSRINKR